MVHLNLETASVPLLSDEDHNRKCAGVSCLCGTAWIEKVVLGCGCMTWHLIWLAIVCVFQQLSIVMAGVRSVVAFWLGIYVGWAVLAFAISRFRKRGRRRRVYECLITTAVIESNM